MSSRNTALVTGSAARLGAAIAAELHRRGCDLILHYNSNEEGARRLADRLNGDRPDSAFSVQADLSDPDAVSTLAEQIKRRGKGLRVLVNNASRFYATRVGETMAWQWEDLFDSNLRGPYFLVQALHELLREAGGSVVNILDIHAERPLREHTVYCMTKAGLTMMTRSLARELGPAVRVNGVSPGAILWPENEPDAEQKKSILDRTVLRRLGEASDVASAVAYLALDAPYVTGQVLAIDGGRSLNM